MSSEEKRKEDVEVEAGFFAKIGVEFFGTALLVFAFNFAQRNPLYQGIAFMVAYLFAQNISGGMFNPAVTVANIFTVAAKWEAILIGIFLIIAQWAGAIGAVAISIFVLQTHERASQLPRYIPGASIVKQNKFPIMITTEFIFALMFFTAYFLFKCHKDIKYQNNFLKAFVLGLCYYGCVGYGVLAGTLFNPTIAICQQLGNYFVDTFMLKTTTTPPINYMKFLPLYVAVPLIAAIAAVFLTKIHRD